MRWWPRGSAPDHPEYGAQAVLPTTVGPFVLTVWNARACSVERVERNGWTSDDFSFGPVDELGVALADRDVPAAEAEALANEVGEEWRARWAARESEVRRPLVDVPYNSAIAVALVPPLVGCVVVLAGVARLAGRLRRPRA